MKKNIMLFLFFVCAIGHSQNNKKLSETNSPTVWDLPQKQLLQTDVLVNNMVSNRVGTMTKNNGISTPQFLNQKIGVALKNIGIQTKYNRTVPALSHLLFEPNNQEEVLASSLLSTNLPANFNVPQKGSLSSCDQSNPENVEDGLQCGASQNWTAANDIIVAAGNDMTLNGITPNLWMTPGVIATSVLITIYDDNAGLPGTTITSQTVVPTSSTVVGSIAAFDISEVVIDLAPVSLTGEASSDVIYWIGIQVANSDNSGVYWSASSASAIGNPTASSSGSGFGIPAPALDGAYVFSASCEPIGGGGGICDQSNPENVEDGLQCGANQNWTAANDIIVAAGNDMTLNGITPNLWMTPGVIATSVLVTIYDDNAGLPGTTITSQTVVPTSSTVVGSIAAFDISEVVIDLAPVSLPGDAGSDVIYWIGIQVANSDNSGVYWSASSASAIGNPTASSSGSGFGIPAPALDGTYVFSASCEPIGGGGSICDQSNPENGFQTGVSCSVNTNTTAANDIIVAAGNDMTLTSIKPDIWMGPGVIATSVLVTIYNDATGLPGTTITSQTVVPTSSTVIGSRFGFDISEVVIDLTPVSLPGDANSDIVYWIGIQVTTDTNQDVFWSVTTASAIGNGIATNDGTGFVIPDPANDGVYLFTASCEPISVVAINDDCSGAIVLECGDSVTGQTLTATNSGGYFTPDVFYKYTGNGTPQFITISTCAASDFDTILRVFDDCDLENELVFNNDYCGSQSEIIFLSDGTSTYFIMVEGYFGNGSGNFSLDLTCNDIAPNDEPENATLINCGEPISDKFDFATIDSDILDCRQDLPDPVNISMPGLWYILDDTMGIINEISISLCEPDTADVYTKIGVYTGSPSNLTCLGYSSDGCGPSGNYPKVTFSSDGNTKYYILIYSQNSTRGNFTLSTSCTPSPPPNDKIVNAIDVDRLGFPYTDVAVNMPLATIENGNPVGCDLTGANGVWYKFKSVGDGNANVTIVTPGGVSAVTFYTAPHEHATETQLTLVPQQTNLCESGSSASITTLAGQAYYMFVRNDGAITDITIDGTLDVSANAFAGFSYYPNPTNDIVSLKSVENIDNVLFYNVLGQLVIDKKVNATTSQIDLSGLSTGTYLMKVSVNGEIGTFRVLKQ